MSPVRRCILVAALGLAAGFAQPTFAVVPPVPCKRGPEAIAEALLRAIEKSDYASIAARPDWQPSPGTREVFNSAESRIGDRLSKPYRVLPLGDLKRDGRQVSLWKIVFLDGGDEMLVSLCLKDGKATGFSVD
jgi:hypothetical protein